MIDHFTSPPAPCSYLPFETASLNYRLVFEMDAAEYAEQIRRGWRRQGMHFFRPECPACVKCRSLRVDAVSFRPSRSQRRALARNADIQVVVDETAVTDEHMRVFNAYHADMAVRKGWTTAPATGEEYFESFLIGSWEFAREFRYYHDGRLVGVGLADVFDDGVSAVYFYHDPQFRPQGPGTFSVLQQIDFARRTGRRWVYLGYWIEECGSMRYKSNFRPCQVLAKYPAADEQPLWQWQEAAMPGEAIP